MSTNGETRSHDGYDSLDHQPAYIYAPPSALVDDAPRPTKRRKKAIQVDPEIEIEHQTQNPWFGSSSNDLESSRYGTLRQSLFQNCWTETQSKIEDILDESNEDSLRKITSFVNGVSDVEMERLPAAFIVTGPNIASQDFLFSQLSARLKADIKGRVVVLRSGDASNLKAILKQVIRDATNQRPGSYDDDVAHLDQTEQKLLNYDLEILNRYVKIHGSRTVVVAFQDSEAFDTNMVADLIQLFHSWRDRIPFTLLFGIATSVDLFHERLSRATSKCLSGSQFNVEQTSAVLEKIFQKAVAGFNVPIRLSPSFVFSLMERQHDHVQSVQSFISSLKYAYMCHFYGNPLSVLISSEVTPASLQAGYLEAVRMLPSFKHFVVDLVKSRNIARARRLLEDDTALIGEIEQSLALKDDSINRLLRSMHVLAALSPESAGMIDIYMKCFGGSLGESGFVRDLLESIRRMAPDSAKLFIDKMRDTIQNGCPYMDLDGWGEESDLLLEVKEIQRQIKTLIDESKRTGKQIQSSHQIHSSTSVRTTVIAQKVQLSYEKSILSTQDEHFTAVIGQLCRVLKAVFTCENPQDWFLNEVWLFGSTRPYKDAFVPSPRAAIERALTVPYDYLDCECCKDGGPATQPTTATIYQWYLEAGSLINVADLWSAFVDNQTPDDKDECDEKEALVLFYRALSDLKLLGMVKQSRRKADHLAKNSWKSL